MCQEYSSFKQVSKIFHKDLPDEEIKTLKSTIGYKDLAIQTADKGNTIVITNKSDHISRLNWILDETSILKGSM